MFGKTIIVLILIAMLTVVGFTMARSEEPAVSPDPGYGPGQAFGMKGPGPGHGPGVGGRGFKGRPHKLWAEFFQKEAVIELRKQMDQTRKEFMALFTQEQVDAEQARKLHQELNRMRNQLSDMRLDYMLEYKAAHPEWKPRYQGRGHRRPGSRRGAARMGSPAIPSSGEASK